MRVLDLDFPLGTSLVVRPGQVSTGLPDNLQFMNLVGGLRMVRSTSSNRAISGPRQWPMCISSVASFI